MLHYSIIIHNSQTFIDLNFGGIIFFYEHNTYTFIHNLLINTYMINVLIIELEKQTFLSTYLYFLSLITYTITNVIFFASFVFQILFQHL